MDVQLRQKLIALKYRFISNFFLVMTLKTIERSIEINATAERVWKVLPGIDYIKK